MQTTSWRRQRSGSFSMSWDTLRTVAFLTRKELLSEQASSASDDLRRVEIEAALTNSSRT